MEFINIIIFSSYKGVASSEFLGLHHTFQRLRLRHKFTLDKALRRGLKGRCVAWDVSPVAPTPFRFLLLFFLCVCVCVCVCVLYYKFILSVTRGAPNKAVEKKRTSAYEANKVREWLQQGSKLLPFKPTNIRTMIMFKLLVL